LRQGKFYYFGIRIAFLFCDYAWRLAVFSCALCVVFFSPLRAVALSDSLLYAPCSLLYAFFMTPCASRLTPNVFSY